MNVALILAGGTDYRFQMSVPKQFVNVFNRPVIVYTLEAFQKHKDIDAIMVACLDGWQEMVKAYAKQDDVIVLHDSIRPFVTEDIITDSIRVCRLHGMGVAAVRTMDTIMRTNDGVSGTESISRYSIVRIQTPQAYHMSRINTVEYVEMFKALYRMRREPVKEEIY